MVMMRTFFAATVLTLVVDPTRAAPTEAAVSDDETMNCAGTHSGDESCGCPANAWNGQGEVAACSSGDAAPATLQQTRIASTGPDNEPSHDKDEAAHRTPAEAFTDPVAIDCQAKAEEFRRRFDCACIERATPRLRNERVAQAREASQQLIQRDRNQLDFIKRNSEKYASREQYERMLSAVTERLKRHEDAGNRIGPDSIDPSFLWLDISSQGICRSPKTYREVRFQECRSGKVTGGNEDEAFCSCYSDAMAASWATAGDISVDATTRALSSCQSSKQR